MRNFHDDMREQPYILNKIVQYYSGDKGQKRLSQLKEVAPNKEIAIPIIFTGMGSSLCAARLASVYLRSLGLESQYIEASELLHYGYDLVKRKSLMFLISQSGECIEIKKLLSIVNKSFLVGITNDLESTLGQKANLVFPILAGEEATVSSKTYTATLATILLVCTSLHKEKLTAECQAIKKASTIISNFEKNVPLNLIINPIVDKLCNAAKIFLLGRGSGAVTAFQGALTFKELVKISVEGMEAAQFRHGPLELAGEDLAVILIAPPGRTDNLVISLAKELKSYGVEVVIIGEGNIYNVSNYLKGEKLLNEFFSALVDIYPIQFIANLLAKKMGRDGQFRYISKVTNKE